MVAALLGLALLGQAWGRAGYVSNNPDVRWRTLETEHFTFHWPESRRDRDDPHWFTTEFTVGQLARIAEESYPKVCGSLDYWLVEKTHVVVYDQNNNWVGNGFAIAEWDWTGFAARWGPTFRQRGRMEFLSGVFVHEFAHIVSLKAYLPWSEGTTGFEVGGLSEDEEWLRRWGIDAKPHTNLDVGFDFLVMAHAPFWWAEGGAEYWSDEAGYNFWGTSRDALLRMTVLEDRIPELQEWTTRIDKEGFEGERGYNNGYAFGLYLQERFGRDVMTAMAHVAGERWHWTWDRVVEEATGVPMPRLYGEWRAWLRERYRGQAQAIEARGVVAGRELSLTEPPWESGDPQWLVRPEDRREEDMDGLTAYQEMPAYSPDGRYLVWFEKGMNVAEIRPEQWGAIGGTYVDEDDGRALRQWERRTATNEWFQYYRVAWAPDSTRFLATGPEDLTQSALRNENGLTFDTDGYNWDQLYVVTVHPEGRRLGLSWEPVPNTLRATEAAWSPDGRRVAFVRYGDGTHEIYLTTPEGDEPRRLTEFADGTQVQGISWTPDGDRLLVSLYTNYRQDLWLLDVQTRRLTRLTESRADETDPVMGPDGRAWFTSDADLEAGGPGVFNVYSLDLETREVRRHTNLLGGAYGSYPTVGGHLLYTAITGHGFRIQGLGADALAQEVVDYPGVCGRSPGACGQDQAYLDWRPSAGAFVDSESRRYNAVKALLPLSGWPLARTTDRNVEVGGVFILGDYTEAHYLEAEVTFGKDNFLYLSYWLDWLPPSIMLGYMRYTYKGTYGYGVDEDGVVETTDDVTVVDLKFEQASDDVWAYVTTTPSYALWGGLGVDASRYSFRDTGDGPRFVPYTEHAGAGFFVEWTPSGSSYWSGDQWVNPRGGRRVYLDYQHRRTRLVDPEMAGAVYDDGELLERYGYNRVQATWTEYIPVTWFGLVGRHTLQLDFEGGFIDRNVMAWDEFIAGGRHPYHWGSGTIGNNVQFSGYEGWSLTGETMLIANLSYRFPLARDLDWKLGPTYTEAVYFQFFGTAGNLWSYRVDGPSHVEGWSVVADDPADIRREVPFADYAYKNSPPNRENYLLTDVGVELRVRSFIFNDWDWDSFVRVAYGLQSTAGYGDVNADLVQSSLARDVSSELSDEVEPPTLRVYAGLGTGW